MTRERVVVRGVTAAVLAAATCCFTFLGWSGLAVDPSGFIRPLVGIAVGVAALGVVLRSLGLPRALVVTLQTVSVLEVLHVRWAGGLAAGGLVPTGASLAEMGATLSRAVDASQQWAAPIPERVESFDPLMIAIGSAVIVLVDAYAVTYRRAVVAGLPLLAAFTLPAAVTGGMRWDHFMLAAGTFLLLVAAEQLHSVGRWGRSLSGVPGSQEGAGQVSSTAELLARNRGALVRVLAPSLVLAAAGSLLVPDDSGILGGSTGGSGTGEVSIKNPIADLRRDLVLGPDVNLLTVRTDDPDPSYLRISVLDEFDGDTWLPSRRELPPRQRADGPLPAPAGLDQGVQQTRYRYQLEASSVLDSQWLPLPFPAVAADAAGDWRYDAETLDVTTTDEDLNTADLAYTATGLQLSPTARQLVDAPSPPAQLADDNTALPFEDSVPEWLDTLVEDLTGDADSDFAAAVALQRWFRDPDNFRYSTARESGNGLDDLRTFLTPGPDGRVGYCEQFASAMAVMARVARIPARVAVGFLEPDPLLPGSWLFSAHDLHAWPELYFEGVGWVRFEPTPADQAPTVPGYTTGQLPQVQQETLPTTSASAASPTRPVRSEDPLSSVDASAGSDESTQWWLAPVVALAVLLLLLVPRLLRSRRRRVRGAVGEAGGGRAAEAAWDELRATVLDLGHHWPDHVTLRGQRHHLLRLVRRAPVGSRAAGARPPVSADDVRAAVDTVVGAVERARFSPVPVSEEEGREAWRAAQVVVQGLADRSEPGARRAATWWPRSLRAAAAPDDLPGAGAGADGGDVHAPVLEDKVRV